MAAFILVIEDEPEIQHLLIYNLESEGFRCLAVENAEDGFRAIKDNRPDLILLDWMLPGMSGIETCRILRSKPETSQLPIIMLTARGEEADRLRGLGTGADDYIVKPFSIAELSARIKSLLRRLRPETVSTTLTRGSIVIDRTKKSAQRGERHLRLSPLEFRLLELFMKQPGRAFSRAQLIELAWNGDAEVDDRTVDVALGRLRKQLCRGKDADPIKTVRGFGYAFDESF